MRIINLTQNKIPAIVLLSCLKVGPLDIAFKFWPFLLCKFILDTQLHDDEDMLGHGAR